MDRELKVLPLADIDARPQVRQTFDPQGIEGLFQSLRSGGLQQPILVRPSGSRWVIVDGERRTRAAKLAGWDSILALVDAGEQTEAERIERQLVANCQREDLTPIEVARATEQLMKAASCTAAVAAEKLGLSQASVSRSLALLTLPEEVQARVHAGRLAASTAYEIAKTTDPERKAELVAAACRGELKREAAALRSRAQPEPTRTRKRRGNRSARRTIIPLDSKHRLILAGEGLPVSDLLALLDQVAARLRAVARDPNADVASVLASLNEL